MSRREYVSNARHQGTSHGKVGISPFAEDAEASGAMLLLGVVGGTSREGEGDIVEVRKSRGHPRYIYIYIYIESQNSGTTVVCLQETMLESCKTRDCNLWVARSSQ